MFLQTVVVGYVFIYVKMKHVFDTWGGGGVEEFKT